MESPSRDYDYSCTIEKPHMLPRTVHLLKALHQGGAALLAEEVYGIAQQHVEWYRGPGQRVPSDMQKLVDDRKGNRDVVTLLHSIPDLVLEACIDNTIGYRWVTDPSFKRLIHSTDSSCGIYINTLALETPRGKFLCEGDYCRLMLMIKNYKRRHRNNAEAIAIDNAFKCSQKDIELTISGRRRYWLNENGGTDVFLQSLVDYRTNSGFVGIDDDPVYQIQSPLEVGCAVDIRRRLFDHSPESGLKNTAKPWGLMLSCLKVMGIQVEVIGIPILITWSQKLMSLGEIVITLISGSKVEDGGYNPAVPGTSSSGKLWYFDEVQKVFRDKRWMQESIQRTRELFAKNNTQLEVIQALSLPVHGSKVQILKHAFAQIRTRFEDMKKKLVETEKEIERWGTRVDDRTQRARQVRTNLQLQIDFERALTDWLFQPSEGSDQR